MIIALTRPLVGRHESKQSYGSKIRIAWQIIQLGVDKVHRIVGNRKSPSCGQTKLKRSGCIHFPLLRNTNIVNCGNGIYFLATEKRRIACLVIILRARMQRLEEVLSSLRIVFPGRVSCQSMLSLPTLGLI